MLFFSFVIVVLLLCVFVFFFKHKTAYEMRISDWSSDVCSSDLDAPHRAAPPSWRVGSENRRRPHWDTFSRSDTTATGMTPNSGSPDLLVLEPAPRGQIGRASCRERACQYV